MLSATKLSLPEGMAVIILRSPGPPIDYSTQPVSLDGSIAAIRPTESFDEFVVVGSKRGTTTMHFPDGDTPDVTIEVTPQ